jgi:hypothetical protein
MLKTSHEPTTCTVLPPSYQSVPTFAKKLDVTGNWVEPTIPPIVVGQKSHVMQGTGLLVWLPWRGVTSIYRMAIAPAGLTLDTNSVYRVSPFKDGRLTFVSQVALPIHYGVVVGNVANEFETMSSCRAYAGRITVTSDTLSIAQTYISGTLSGTAVSDVRMLLYPPVDGSYGTVTIGTDICTSANMAQLSCTMKDTVKNVSLATGVTVVQGSDICPHLMPPNSDNLVVRQGTPLMNTTMTENFTPIDTSTGNGGSSHLRDIAWFSPYNMTYEPLLTTARDFRMLIDADNFMTDVYGGSYLFYVSLILQPGGGHSYSNDPINFLYMAEHLVDVDDVYMSVDANGLIIQDVISTTYPIAPCCNVEFLNAEIYYSISHSAFNARGRSLGTDGHSVNEINGIYVGSLVTLITRNTGTVNWTAQGDAPVIQQYKISVVSEADIAFGQNTPARVIRWDGVQPGTQMRVSGVVMAECVPQRATAGFVQSASTMSRVCENINTLSLLSFIYNIPETPFRRVWPHDEWKDFCMTQLRTLSPNTLLGYNHTKLTAAAMAAGVFPPTSTSDVFVAPVSTSNPQFVADDADTRSVMSMGKRLRGADDLSVTIADHTRSVPAPRNADAVSMSDRWRELDRIMAPIAQTRQRRDTSNYL